MNYQSHYDRLIEKHGTWVKPKGIYTERHRKLPGCMGGKYVEGNAFYMDPRAHFVAHQLLVKLYPGNQKIACVVWCMTISKSDTPRNNRVYSWLRNRYSQSHHMKSERLRKVMSEHATGRTGLKFTEESKRKLSQSQIVRHARNPGSVAGENNGMYGVTGENHPMFGRRGVESPIYGDKNGMYGVVGKNHHCFGKKIINNGVKEARLDPSKELPAGWKFGRLEKV